MNFETITNELYGLPLDQFVAARDARAAEARKAKKKELTRQLKALGKPTQSAWFVNQLVRHNATLMEQLFQLGSRFRKAQEELDGEQLRDLTTRRRELLQELVEASRALATLSDAAEKEVVETLSAAIADPDSAAQVRSGRLTQPLQHSEWALLEGNPRPPRKKDPKREARKAELRERLQQEEATHDRLKSLVEKLQTELEKARHSLELSENKLEKTRAESERLEG